jgi:tryptophanyl-tRNA synthetase
MTNSDNNNGKNSNSNGNDDVVLAKFQGEIAKKILAELETGHGFKFNAVEEEDGNPIVELIRD